MGVFAYSVDVDRTHVDAETEMFSGGFIMLLGCFSHDHKLDLMVVRQTLTRQRYIDDILEHIHISEQIKKHAPYFRTTMPVHIAHILLQILLHRRGLRIFSD